MYRVLTFLLLMVTWLVLSGLFDAFHLGLGVLSSLAVTGLSWQLLWRRPDLKLGVRVSQAVGLLGYLFWLLRQIILSNIQILKLALNPKGVDPVIIHHHTALKTEFARYVLAQSITLTPGTVTVKIDDNELIVHGINGKAAQGLGGDGSSLELEMERRIAAVFEPDLLRGDAT